MHMQLKRRKAVRCLGKDTDDFGPNIRNVASASLDRGKPFCSGWRVQSPQSKDLVFVQSMPRFC
jgi:hypothetical protein